MCLTKKHNFTTPTVAKDNIYILKSSFNGAFDRVFVSPLHNFAYLRHNVYEKGWWSKFKAFFKLYLNGEVFHAHNLETSKKIAGYIAYYTQDGEDYGIFVIPKGTKYYESDSYDIGTFAIRYYGVLTEGNKHLILNQ